MKKQRNSWIITVPLIAVASGYLYFFFLPASNAVADLRQELKETRSFIEQSGNVRIAVKASDDELTQILGYNKAWRDAAPTQATLSALLGDINQLAKDAGVELTNFHPQQDTLNETFARVPINIEFAGTTPSVVQFLGDIEDLPSTVWVETLNIEATGQHGQTAKGELTLVVLAANSGKSD
ncbi:MAG: type 4a pilus biogenesis protein PilO [Pirellulales bacterium]|nr:type 4a pilus biogenesis protein PilO [Pirellulales bacterium]